MLKNALMITGVIAIATSCTSNSGEKSMSASENFTPIKTAKKFRAIVADKKIVDNDGGSYVLASSGTLKGDWQGKSLRGNWVWKNNTLCRTLTTPSSRPYDCQVLSYKGNQLKGVRESGKGSTYIVTMK